MSGGRIALLVFGIVFLVGALVLGTGAAGMMWLSKGMENDDSLFASRTTRLKANSYAIVSEPFHIDWQDDSQGAGWDLGSFAKVKVAAESTAPSNGIFVGIAKATDVNDYLSGVKYHEMMDWSSDPFEDPEVRYELHSGNAVPSKPATATFWEVSTHGPGRQTLEWTPDMGQWVLVIMNEDGSAGIDVKGEVGAELPWLFWIGLGLLLVSVVALVGGAIMIYFAARSPKKAVTVA